MIWINLQLLCSAAACSACTMGSDAFSAGGCDHQVTITIGTVCGRAVWAQLLTPLSIRWLCKSKRSSSRLVPGKMRWKALLCLNAVPKTKYRSKHKTPATLWHWQILVVSFSEAWKELLRKKKIACKERSYLLIIILHFYEVSIFCCFH